MKVFLSTRSQRLKPFSSTVFRDTKKIERLGEGNNTTILAIFAVNEEKYPRN